jgi:hypothetical protein
MEKTIIEAQTLLREYAENRWFTGEREVAELQKAQNEHNEENWSAEIKAGEQNDPESEFSFVLAEQEKERDDLFSRYSKKYHQIHDLIRDLESLKK